MVWLVGWLVGWLAGWLVNRLLFVWGFVVVVVVRWLVGWLASLVAGWFVKWTVGCCFFIGWGLLVHGRLVV